MLPPLDLADQDLQIVDPAPQRPGRDLAMKDLRRDVGIIGRKLAPAGRAILRRQADESDELIAEGFKSADLQLHASDMCWTEIGPTSRSRMMRSAARCASMMVGALVLPEVMQGKAEASATRRPLTPKTLSSGSSTAVAGLSPMRQVETGWKTVPQRWRKSSRISSSSMRSISGAMVSRVKARIAFVAAMRWIRRPPAITSSRSFAVER